MEAKFGICTAARIAVIDENERLENQTIANTKTKTLETWRKVIIDCWSFYYLPYRNNVQLNTNKIIEGRYWLTVAEKVCWSTSVCEKNYWSDAFEKNSEKYAVVNVVIIKWSFSWGLHEHLTSTSSVDHIGSIDKVR